ncbi:hypothetical protein ZWY2020_002216 [Hordeum vulgare]|nr:hypothetical protein ZWY2020_002216 [Hordeum vulgare]
MGKKKSWHGKAEKVVEVAARPREFALKVAMHCRCHGCMDRVRAVVRDLTLAPGVEAVDQSAAKATGEAQVLATSDPERLRKGLRKATSRKVDLVFPPAKEHKNEEREHARPADASSSVHDRSYTTKTEADGDQDGVWRCRRRFSSKEESPPRGGGILQPPSRRLLSARFAGATFGARTTGTGEGRC